MQETNEVAACCDTTSPKHEKRKIPLVVFSLLVDSLRVTLPPIYTANTQQPMLHTLMGALRGHLSCSITFSWDLETNQCQGFKPHTHLPVNLNLELDIFLERTHLSPPHAHYSFCLCCSLSGGPACLEHMKLHSSFSNGKHIIQV